ncbi:methyladenine glycosylase [Catenovulum agarivorans DS-2]|uniref:Methyladenine glycosylase n=1 Tax=Catenovulum agarivorans DS-2 TaxID=1328313 RepID=W7QJH2_9ALTE|nr:DNA-3-methyladenine glycosylase I [Catenovulum agarivorans]EWH09092.1 methyladenine glycosylase [Catenovulum agarivorans DS-2]
MERFDNIIERAIQRKGNEQVVMSYVGTPLSNQAIAQITDDRFLAAFTKKVFQSGFVWRVVENKWPNFEECFFAFEIEKILMMPAELLEKKAADPKIIRNGKKVQSIYENALMIHDVQIEYGHSFSQFIADWPESDRVGLWGYLKKHGCRLGGNTGPYALRALGIDTFLLTQDVEAYFRANKLIEGGATSKRSLQQIQQGFNEWRDETGLSYQALSQILAMSVGDNRIAIAE